MNEPNTNDTNLQARLETLEARERQRAKRTRILLAAGIACALATPFAVRALSAVPNVFSAGSPIVAADLNANFAHVVAGVTAVEARTAALEGRSPGRYVGFTTATTTGSMSAAYPVGTPMRRGYRAARAFCQLEFGATAHMCSAEEIFQSAQLGLTPVADPPSVPADGAMWVGEFSASADYYGSPSPVLLVNYQACVGWTSGLTGTQGGPTWAPGPERPDASDCSVARRIACCD